MVATNQKPKSTKHFNGDYNGRIIYNVTIMDLPNTIWTLWYHLLTSYPLFVNIHSNPWLLELKANYDYHSFSSNRVIELRPN
ncbi:hypothetical protein H5410_035791 [Solanum commersonii]|uniref:Uncharacterized protein n=1 Tax=Solanum commersonii TaxID=4109 RepID=A0A9J5Y3V7_SOLCO|nr:hypothetical protein H5410_035791 [Solanum commersonii]